MSQVELYRRWSLDRLRPLPPNGPRRQQQVAIMAVGQGSTVIGVGLVVGCPSNVTDNTAVNNPGGNLVLNGTGCNNTNNVAP
jgi:hypothetical protein